MALVPPRPHLLQVARWVALVLTTAIVASACSGDEPDDHQVVPAQNATEAALLPTDAAALPSMDLAGYEELIAQLHGTPVVVNFWGSWCDPCRDEAPRLAAAHDAYGDRVQFLGVDILDARGSAREFMKEFGWTYPSVYDGPGAIRDGLGILGQPVTLVYDRSGEIVQRWIGPVPQDELTAQLDALEV